MTNASYVESWDDYRRRVRWFFGAWLGGFAVAAALAGALSYTPASSWAPIAVGALWIAAFALTAFRLQLFRCPRCHEQFFSGTWGYWPFARSCRHCGLAKWQH